MANFMLSWAEHEKSFITSGPDINPSFGLHRYFLKNPDSISGHGGLWSNHADAQANHSIHCPRMFPKTLLHATDQIIGPNSSDRHGWALWCTVKSKYTLRFSQRFWKRHQVLTLFCLLFVLRFYGPVNPMGSCRVLSVYLPTLLLGRLSPLSG